MCISGSNKATRQAAKAEEQRTAQISAGNQAVDRAFEDRQPQYDQFADALRSFYRTDAERQKTIADRQLKFSLARGGLTGGSAAKDAGTNLGREFTEGLLGAERQTQTSLADLLSRDEQSRMNLLSLVQGGADATSAASRAASAQSRMYS
jgi:hypothetical protein